MKIVHFVYIDKFTIGYINFMKIKFPQHQHYFFVWPPKRSIKLAHDESIYHVKSWKELYFDSEIKSILKAADKIIITGMFGIQSKLLYMPSWFTQKTYIQFWGGDFYRFREKKWHLSKLKTHIFLKRCHGFINLIKEDRKSLYSVFPIEKKCFIAPVPSDPKQNIDYLNYPIKRTSTSIKILVGNSATEANQHMEAYDILSKFKDENIEIFSPLSYGSEKYRDQVISYGRKIYGDKFHPLTQFMPLHDYVDFLSSIDVGIFNNNRQQALGNISALLALGKKVYIRNDTSMWNSLKEMGFHIENILVIPHFTLKNLVFISKDEIDENKKAYKHYRDQAISQWDTVFKDK